LYRAVEGVPPTVTISNRAENEAELAVGLTSKSLEVVLSDAHAGLRSAKIAVEYPSGEKTLFEESSLGAVQSITTNVALPTDLPDGAASLIIDVVDTSLRSNSTRLNVPLFVDRQIPLLRVLTQQHIAAQGGAQFVVFRASDASLQDSFVAIGQQRFPAVAAADFDERFAAYPDVYAVLFAIPFDHDSTVQPIELTAIDKAGNAAKQALRFRITPFRQRAVTPNLSENFLDQIIPRLLPEFIRESGEELDPNDTTERARHFNLINEGLRGFNNQIIDTVTAVVTPVRHWNSIMVRPMAGSLSSNLGEQRSYQYQGETVSFSKHLGLDIASVVNDSVQAAHAGTVRFTGNLGIYGNTVIIDHGLGLFSLYSHLSSIAVQNGDSVNRGDEIARSGETGLAGGDHLHFELRIGTLPVNPIEWWDEKWLRDQVDGKLEAALGVLNAEGLSKG
jgi:murein DD-endopeptidase MepM/ murein hydrolase activator NlpD